MHQDSKEWRSLQLNACKELSDSWLEFRWLLYVPAHGSGKLDKEAQGKFGPLGTKCAQCVAGVILVFGGDAGEPVGEDTRVLDCRISQLKNTAAPNSEGGWITEAQVKIRCEIKNAGRAHEAFREDG
jgi:hypothetical protein